MSHFFYFLFFLPLHLQLSGLSVNRSVRVGFKDRFGRHFRKQTVLSVAFRSHNADKFSKSHRGISWK